MDQQRPESDQRWACVPKDAEGHKTIYDTVYKTGFRSRDAALEALEGQPGEIVRYESGFPAGVAAGLFDIDHVLAQAECRAGASVLWPSNEAGLFETATEEDLEDLKRALAAAVVGWVDKAKLPIWRVLEREEVELVPDAKDCPA